MSDLLASTGEKRKDRAPDDEEDITSEKKLRSAGDVSSVPLSFEDESSEIRYEADTVTVDIWKYLQTQHRCLLYAQNNIKTAKKLYDAAMKKGDDDDSLEEGVSYLLIQQMREIVYEVKYAIESLKKDRPLWCKKRSFEIHKCLAIVADCLDEKSSTQLKE